MRIVQLVQSPQRRGAEVYAATISSSLRARGHSVFTLYLESSSGAHGYISLSDADRILFPQFPGALTSALTIAPILRQLAPDVVQVNGSSTVKTGAVCAYLSPRRRWCLVRRVIGDPQAWLDSGLKRVFYDRVVSPQVDGVIAVGLSVLRGLGGRTLRRPHEVILGAVDVQALVPSASRGDLRRRHGVTSDDGLLVWVGSLTPEKRADRMLRVLRIILNSGVSAKLWIVGDGRLRDELNGLARQLEILDRVSFFGVQSCVADFISPADLLVLTSDTEGVPGVLLEAGALSVPVIATDVGGVRECVDSGVTGYLFPPHAEQSMAQSICQLLTLRRGQLRCMGEAAKQRTLQVASLEVATDLTLGLYRRVLETRSGRLLGMF